MNEIASGRGEETGLKMALSEQEEVCTPILKLHGLVFAAMASELPIRSLLSLGVTCKGMMAELKQPELWDCLLAARFPHHNRSQDQDESPRRSFMLAVMQERVGTASDDFTIAGLSKPRDPIQETWWNLVDGGDFGRYAKLRTICWGEWFAWREVPAGDWDLVIKMRWNTDDFNRVERPTVYKAWFYSTIKAEDLRNLQNGRRDMFGQVKDTLQATALDPVLLSEWAVSNENRSSFKNARNQWVLFNLGNIKVPKDNGLVVLHYFGCCPNWFSGWDIDWVSFRPVGLTRPGISLHADMIIPV